MTNPWLRREVPVTTQLLTDEQHKAFVKKLRRDWYIAWMLENGHDIKIHKTRFNPALHCSVRECKNKRRESNLIYYVTADRYICKSCEAKEQKRIVRESKEEQ